MIPDVDVRGTGENVEAGPSYSYPSHIPLHLWEMVVSNLHGRDRDSVARSCFTLRQAVMHTVTKLKLQTDSVKSWVQHCSDGSPAHRLYTATELILLRKLSFLDGASGLRLPSDLLCSFLEHYSHRMPQLSTLELLSLKDRLTLPSVLQTLQCHLPNIAVLTLPLPDTYGMTDGSDTEGFIFLHIGLMTQLKQLTLGHEFTSSLGVRLAPGGQVTATGLQALTTLTNLSRLSISNCVTHMCNNAIRAIGEVSNSILHYTCAFIWLHHMEAGYQARP